jgi:hypothetical protein
MIGAGGSRPTIREGGCLTNSINGMKLAGVMLAIAMCCGATQASAQLRVFAGPGNGNQPAPGAAGLGTAGLGLGGFGSAESVGGTGATDATAEPGKGLNFGGQNQGGALGANGANAAPAQGSLSSAIDRPSSPINSVTNSLMGPVGTGATIPATKPVAKRKPATKAAAAPSSGGADVASKVPAKNP